MKGLTSYPHTSRLRNYASYQVCFWGGGGVAEGTVLLPLPARRHLLLQLCLLWPAISFKGVLSLQGGTGFPGKCTHKKSVWRKAAGGKMRTNCVWMKRYMPAKTTTESLVVDGFLLALSCFRSGYIWLHVDIFYSTLHKLLKYDENMNL